MVEIAAGLVEYMASSTGAIHVELRGAGDPESAVRALTAARGAIYRIPHPEEPSEPLPSFASDVTATDDGATFWFDAADAEAYDGLLDQVAASIAAAIDEAGVGGRLTWPEGP
jgi:hypothetical protein